MTSNSVATISRPSDREFQKLSQQYKRAEKETLQFCIDFAAAWKRLNGDTAEKEHLAKLFGWSDRYAQKVAQIGRVYPAKRAIIEKGASSTTPLASIGQMQEIVQIDDDNLYRLAQEGLFEREPALAEIRRAGKTGIVPFKAQPKPIPKTPKAKIKEALLSAASDINRAAGHISVAHRLMDEHSLPEFRGLEVTKLRDEFQRLCAVIAAADPNTVEQARKILLGKA